MYQPEVERNYHIFYQLCAGAPLKERKDLGLETDVTKFHYLRQGGPNSSTISGVDDAEEFRATQDALSTVGIGIDKQWSVFRLLAALLHLGNIAITGVRNDSNIADQEPSLLLSTRFLGISPVEFKKWTIKKQITTRSEKITTSLNLAQANVVRDSVAKFLYACLFEWLVAIVNDSLAGEGGEAANRAEMFIGVCITPPFQILILIFCRYWISTASSISKRTPSSNFVSITPMKSSNKRSVTVPRHEVAINPAASSMPMSSNSSKRNTFENKSSGSSSTSPTTNLASMSSKASSVFSPS